MVVEIISKNNTAVYVDITESVSLSRNINNPIIAITVPTSLSSSKLKAGSYGINLKMMSDRITMSFVLRDGWGTHKEDGTGTKYEKLCYIIKQAEKGVYLNLGQATKTHTAFGYVIDASFSTPGGYKDIINSSVTVLLCNSEDELGTVG